MGASKGTHKKVIDLVGNITNKRILDCGAGSGKFTRELLNKSAEVFACDMDKSKFNLKIPFKYGDFNKKIPFKEKYFDKIICIEVIEHLENISNFISEVNRVLKTGGEFILTTPNIHNIKSKLQFLFKTDFHWFNKEEFGKKGSKHIHPVYWREIIFLLEKGGFTIKKISSNRYRNYTIYPKEGFSIFKKSVIFFLNSLADFIYRLVFLFSSPKNKDLLLGDILILSCKKEATLERESFQEILEK